MWRLTTALAAFLAILAAALALRSLALTLVPMIATVVSPLPPLRRLSVCVRR